MRCADITIRSTCRTYMRGSIAYAPDVLFNSSDNQVPLMSNQADEERSEEVGIK